MSRPNRVRMTVLPDHGRFVHRTAPTPLVALELGPDRPTIWCKLEFLNPSGSTKDRIARYMLEKAWRSGRLRAGGRVVEASSGSTSIAMALACAQMGVRFLAVMPEGVSDERLWTIRAYGGEIRLTPRAEGVRGAVAVARELGSEEGSFAPLQFENPDNPEAHRVWTGQEILSQIPGCCVDAVVSGVGTGGTLLGLHEAFTEAGCQAVPVMARPIVGTNLGGIECCAFSSRVPGVVDGISRLFDPSRLPGLLEIDVDDDLALDVTRLLIRRGFPVGPSSGLNFAAAEEASRRLGSGRTVVTVFPDRMDRYYSTELFAPMRGG